MPAVRQNRHQVCLPAAASWCPASAVQQLQLFTHLKPEGGLDVCCRLCATFRVSGRGLGIIMHIAVAPWPALEAHSTSALGRLDCQS